MSTSAPLLEIRGLEFYYKQIHALKNLSLQIAKGEIVSLIGANGAGKTTLLRTLSALQAPQAGEIWLEGRKITALPSEARVRLGIAHVPEGRGLFSVLSVEDNILLGAYLRNDVGVADDLASVYQKFPILKEKRKAYAGTLSGGQQQMLAVGRALMSRPKLLLLDEPSMGLAPVVVEQIFEVIQGLQKEGTTLFLVEQNAFLALQISDRTYVLENGVVTLEGASAALLDDTRIKEAYLGM